MALRAGFSDEAIAHRLVRHHWTRLHAGVYFTHGPEPTYRDWLAGTLLATGPRSTLSGAAALTLWGMRDVTAPRRPLVLVPAGTGSTAYRAIHVRATPIPFRVSMANGLRTAGLARSIADYAVASTSARHVLGVVTEAIRRRLCTAEAIQQAYLVGPRRGSAHLRDAVQAAMLNAWSVPEGLIGRALRQAGSPPFEHNVTLRDASGQVLGIADVWWAHLQAGLEVHGAETHSSGADWADTVRRASRLEQIGVSVMAVPAIDVLRDADGVAQAALRWLAALAQRSAHGAA